MAVRSSEAVWTGTLKDGSGKMKFGSGAYEGTYTWSSRFENGKGTNPEELLGAAHAGCFSMALSSNLGKAGFTPLQIHTTAQVTLEPVEGKNLISKIHLETEVKVDGISDEQFQQIAQIAKQNCPVSVALSNVPIRLTARLLTA